MKKRLFALMAKRKDAVTAMETAIGTDGYDTAKAAVAALNAEIDQVQAAIDEAERYGTNAADSGEGTAAGYRAPATAASGDDPRASREYARAFCQALAARARGDAQAFDTAAGVIFAAMSESGGTTPGENGGFLVPVDMQTRINETRRTLDPLAQLFTEEVVTAPTGFRVLDTHPAAGFTKVSEMGEIPLDDQPKFERIKYAVEDYALIVPVSNDLLGDETAGLMAYLSQWFARKSVLTENALLLALLGKLTPTAIAAGKELSTLKGVLNKKLDPAISLTASILTNQDGFDFLDQLVDGNNRPLLMPDPTNATVTRLAGRTVHVASNAVLKTTTGKAPIYLGDFAQYGTLFRREPLQVDATSIGGNSWRTNSTEVRGITRLDAQQFDKEAAAAVTLTL